MDDAGIREFFDGLHDPAGFATARTAIAQRVPRLLAARRTGVDPWLADALHALVGHVTADGDLLGAALVQTADACRIAEQEPCEQVAWFVGRLARETRRLREPWVAVAVPDASADGVPLWRYEVTNLRSVRVSRLRWYAETRSPRMAAAFTGSVDLAGLDAGRVDLAAPDAGSVDLAGLDAGSVNAVPVRPSDAGVLGRVLHGHPDRRRYRIRTASR